MNDDILFVQVWLSVLIEQDFIICFAIRTFTDTDFFSSTLFFFFLKRKWKSNYVSWEVSEAEKCRHTLDIFWFLKVNVHKTAYYISYKCAARKWHISHDLVVKAHTAPHVTYRIRKFRPLYFTLAHCNNYLFSLNFRWRMRDVKCLRQTSINRICMLSRPTRRSDRVFC